MIEGVFGKADQELPPSAFGTFPRCAEEGKKKMALRGREGKQGMAALAGEGKQGMVGLAGEGKQEWSARCGGREAIAVRFARFPCKAGEAARRADGGAFAVSV